MPSTRGLVSVLLSSSMPLSQLLRGAHVSSESVATKVEEVNELGSVKDEKEQELDDSDEVFGGWDSLGVGNRGSIAERRAARCGFNAHRLNTARFICTSPLSSPAAACSPYLTIPSGLSPTALLNSPDLSSNSQVKKMSWKSMFFYLLMCRRIFFVLLSVGNFGIGNAL